MKRTVVSIFVALAALALFVVLVRFVLVAAHLDEPAATTVNGFTPRRAWATAAMVLGLVGVIAAGLAMRKSARSVVNGGRSGAIIALLIGLIAAVNGALNLAVAKGGPGSGNGVIGGAAALVLGLIAMALGVITVARSRHRNAVEQTQ